MPTLRKQTVRVTKASTSWKLQMLPLPYDYTVTLGGQTFSFTESCVVWRAFIDGTEMDIQEEKPKPVVQDDAKSLLEKMMKGTKITK